MQRGDMDTLAIKLARLEGRTLDGGQKEAWLEILEPHTLADALDAVVVFHSKPYKRPAYPGDLKALIQEAEGVRLRRCGTLEATEEDWVVGHPSPIYARLRHLVGTGEWSPEDYRAYRRSGLTLDEHLEQRAAPVG